MKRKKILITGKLPKTHNAHSKMAFDELATALGKDVAVLFPTSYAEPEADWSQSIKSDITRLMMCEELHLLHNWQGHKRSEILRNTAMSVGIKCIYH